MVDDVIGYFGKEVVGEVGPVGCHGICRSDGTKCYGALICALVAHYPYALHGEQYYPCLPYLVIQAVVAQTLDEDVVGFLEHMHFFRSDVAEYAHCQAGAGSCLF